MSHFGNSTLNLRARQRARFRPRHWQAIPGQVFFPPLAGPKSFWQADFTKGCRQPIDWRSALAFFLL